MEGRDGRGDRVAPDRQGRDVEDEAQADPDERRDGERRRGSRGRDAAEADGEDDDERLGHGVREHDARAEHLQRDLHPREGSRHEHLEEHSLRELERHAEAPRDRRLRRDPRHERRPRSARYREERDHRGDGERRVPVADDVELLFEARDAAVGVVHPRDEVTRPQAEEDLDAEAPCVREEPRPRRARRRSHGRAPASKKGGASGACMSRARSQACFAPAVHATW